MCLYPKLIKNRKYTATKKNGGIIPPVFDKRTLLVPVGCGKCMECLKQKSRWWSIRLQEEIRTDKTGKFINFSFSNESIIKLSKEFKEINGYNLDNEIATLATRLFLERWRKKFGKSVKHWFVTELGQKNTERIHIHGILFTNENNETIKEIWKYGNIFIGTYVNEITINYIVKYISKTDPLHKEYTPKILTSKGIGKNYLNRADSKNNKYKGKDTKDIYKTRQNIKMGLPGYYRNKLYTDEERELLWLDKLDKKIRWIDGTKIDISKTEDNYYKRLEIARKKNKRLGYGDDKINWERKQYEKKRRWLKHQEIKKKM